MKPFDLNSLPEEEEERERDMGFACVEFSCNPQVPIQSGATSTNSASTVTAIMPASENDPVKTSDDESAREVVKKRKIRSEKLSCNPYEIPTEIGTTSTTETSTVTAIIPASENDPLKKSDDESAREVIKKRKILSEEFSCNPQIPTDSGTTCTTDASTVTTIIPASENDPVKKSGDESGREVIKKRKIRSEFDDAEIEVARILKRMHRETREEEQEPRSPDVQDPWKIKKTLTSSDVNGSARLLLAATDVRTNIMPSLTSGQRREVEGRVGLQVIVFDEDSGTHRQLTFKRWSSTSGYILNNGWTQGFVNRRLLKAGDEIGLYWENNASRFNFRVLRRALLLHWH